MPLPTIRSPRHAIGEAIADHLSSISITPLDGGAAYSLNVNGRVPSPGDTVTLPAVAVIVQPADVRRHEPQEVTGTRSPAVGAGTVLMRLGEYEATVLLVVQCGGDEDTEDEVCGAIEQALWPDANGERGGTANIVLTSAAYHGAKIAVGYDSTGQVEDPQEKGVWRTVITCFAACPILSGTFAAADFQPEIRLTADDDGEYIVDPVDGTTTEPD